MTEVYRFITAQQRDWADQQGIKYDKGGYTLRLDDNLYGPLSPATLDELKHGKVEERIYICSETRSQG